VTASTTDAVQRFPTSDLGGVAGRPLLPGNQSPKSPYWRTLGACCRWRTSRRRPCAATRFAAAIIIPNRAPTTNLFLTRTFTSEM